MRYFISQSHMTQPKNRAHEYVQNFIKKFEHTIIDSDESLDCLCKQLDSCVMLANKIYSRCKDLKLSVNNYLESTNSICVFISDDMKPIATFSIYPVLKVFHEVGLTYELFTLIKK